MIRATVLLGLLALPACAETQQPAELPPPGYAGLQYVDSKGCIFVRAGSGSDVLWIPRVSRQGVPDCSHPPSGRQVPFLGEGGDASFATLDDPAEQAEDTSAEVGTYFVAVGSFGVPANADQAQARVAELSYGTVRGQVQGGSDTLLTVYAGPFPDLKSARAARKALREAGFADAMLVGP